MRARFVNQLQILESAGAMRRPNDGKAVATLAPELIAQFSTNCLVRLDSILLGPVAYHQ